MHTGPRGMRIPSSARLHALHLQYGSRRVRTCLLAQLCLVVGAKRVAQRIHLGRLAGGHGTDGLAADLRHVRCGDRRRLVMAQGPRLQHQAHTLGSRGLCAAAVARQNCPVRHMYSYTPAGIRRRTSLNCMPCTDWPRRDAFSRSAASAACRAGQVEKGRRGWSAQQRRRQVWLVWQQLREGRHMPRLAIRQPARCCMRLTCSR